MKTPRSVKLFLPFLALILGGCASIEKPLSTAPPRHAAQGPFAMRLANADHFLELDQFPEAIQELRAAEAIASDVPDRLRVAEGLGRAYAAIRDWRQAQDHYSRGVDLAKQARIKGPLVADLHAGLGLSLLMQSRFSLAAASVRQGLEVGPSPAARKRMEGDLDKALLEEGLARGDLKVSPEAPPARIRRILVHGNRVELPYLRSKLPFREGDTLGPDTLQKAREALFAMGLFKQVAVSSAPAGQGEADVSIFVRDGWYIIPIPFAMAGGGGSSGGAFVSARNILRKNESFSLVGMGGRSGSRGMFGAYWEGWSANLFFTRSEGVARTYADDGASAGGGFGDALDSKNPAKYGSVLTEYHKRIADAGWSFGFPMGRGLSGEVGWEFQQLGYGAIHGLAPVGAGHNSKAHAAVRTGGEGNPGDLGAILGFGLADIENRIKPLARPRFGFAGSASIHAAAPASGSDYYFWYHLIQTETSYSWGRRERVALRISGGQGGGLPEHQLLTTGDDAGLQGTYARNHRGRGIVGASLSYSAPFWITRKGMFQATVFGEGAFAWTYGRPRQKTGAGFSVWYRFWRFPIPLGFTYTYSGDNQDAQVSAAIGGSF